MFKQFFKSIIVSILTLEAKLVLRKYKPRIVAVTGSVGKTTTKDALYAVLAGSFHVRKSEKSFNSDIGVPLTILGLSNGWNNPILWFKNILKGFFLLLPRVFRLGQSAYPEWLVLEVGADRPGDIKSLAEWLCPDVVVVTRIPRVPAHVEFFASAEALIAEKAELVKNLRPGGLLILNADDPEALAMKDVVRERSLLTFGLGPEADLRASNYEAHYAVSSDMFPSGISFKANAGGNSVPIFVSGALGEQLIYPMLAGLALGIGENLNLVEVAEALKTFVPPPGRMRLIRGVKNTLIIDDTYNSSPAALHEALRTLSSIHAPSGRKIAVLGDMLELGAHTASEHEKAGKLTASSCQRLYTVGIRARHIAEGALSAGMSEKDIFQYDTSEEVARDLEPVLSEGDVVLVKGSQRVRAEKIVRDIMAEPQRAGELLVRQGKEWKQR